MAVAGGNGGFLESAGSQLPMTFRFAAAVLTLCACGGGTPPNTIPGDHGPALTVEVLNASGRAGDAKVATRLLRRAGIDVVYFGNAPPASPAPPTPPTDPLAGLDSTRIIVRRGSAKAGERVRAALGVGRVEVRLDSARLLDVSVLLGADFSPGGGGGGGGGAKGTLDFHP